MNQRITAYFVDRFMAKIFIDLQQNSSETMDSFVYSVI